MDPVIIFDSGVGGLSIFREIVKLNLPFPLVYLADQAYFPYGNLSSSELIQRLLAIIAWIKSQSPKLVVLACNTATVTGIKFFRNKLDCPVVGVEPVVKPLASYRRPLICGTLLTCHSPRTESLSKKYNTTINLYTPPGLVKAIENMKPERIQKSLQSLRLHALACKCDAIGFSCTHYPLILDRFRNALVGFPVYDPSLAVAKRVKSILGGKSSSSSDIFCWWYTTGNSQFFANQVKYYLNLNNIAVTQLTL